MPCSAASSFCRWVVAYPFTCVLAYLLAFGSCACYSQTTSPPVPSTGSTVTANTGAPVFDVRHFGARCDGVSDDTQSIQAAVSAATKAKGGQVSLPASGKCRANVLIDSVSGVELVGSTHYATALQAANGAGLVAADSAKDVVTIVADSADASNDSVRDLTIVGGRNGINIVSHNSYQAKFGAIERVSIINSRQDGIRFEGNHSAGKAVTWKWTLNEVHVYKADANCFEQDGWVEQITYDDPYCGSFGHDAFLVHSINLGSGPLSYQTVIRSPSIGPYSGSKNGPDAGFDFEFINTEGSVVQNPYNDLGTANYAHLVGTYYAEFVGVGHGGIGGDNRGFVFEGLNVATHIDLMNWRNMTKIASLINKSATLIDLRLGFHGGGTGPGAAPFTPSDWDGGTPSRVFYEYDQSNPDHSKNCDVSTTPCIRASIKRRNQTGSIPETTAYETQSEGQYRVCYDVYSSSADFAGVDGQISLTDRFGSPNSVFRIHGLGGCFVMHAAAGQRVSYGTLVNPPSSTYGLDLVVEQLQ